MGTTKRNANMKSRVINEFLWNGLEQLPEK